MTRKTRQAKKKPVITDEEVSSDEIVDLPRKTSGRLTRKKEDNSATINLKNTNDSGSDSEPVQPDKSEKAEENGISDNSKTAETPGSDAEPEQAKATNLEEEKPEEPEKDSSVGANADETDKETPQSAENETSEKDLDSEKETPSAENNIEPDKDSSADANEDEKDKEIPPAATAEKDEDKEPDEAKVSDSDDLLVEVTDKKASESASETKENIQDNIIQDAEPEKPKIRLVPLDKLLKPDILKKNNQDTRVTTTAKSRLQRPSNNFNRNNKSSSFSSRNRKNVSYIEISDSDEEDEIEISDSSKSSSDSDAEEVIVKRTTSRRGNARNSNSVNSTKSKNAEDAWNASSSRVKNLKNLSVTVSKMPNNVNKLMKVYKVHEKNDISPQSSSTIELDDIESLISTSKIEKKKEDKKGEDGSSSDEIVTSTTKEKAEAKKSPAKKSSSTTDSKRKKSLNSEDSVEESVKPSSRRSTRRSTRPSKSTATSSAEDDATDKDSDIVVIKKDLPPIQPIKISKKALQSTSEEKPEVSEKGKLKITIKLNQNASSSKKQSSESSDDDICLKKLKEKSKGSDKASSADESKETSSKRSTRSNRNEEKSKKKQNKRKESYVSEDEVEQEEDQKEEASRTTRTRTRNAKKVEEIEKETEELEEPEEVDGPRNRKKINPLFKSLKEKFEEKKKRRSDSLDKSVDSDSKSSERSKKEKKKENKNDKDKKPDPESDSEHKKSSKEARDEKEASSSKDKKSTKRKRVISSSDSETGETSSKRKRKMSSSEENYEEEKSGSEQQESGEEEEEQASGSEDEEIVPKKNKRKAKKASSSENNSDDSDMLDEDRPKEKRKRKRIKKMASSDEDGENDKDKNKGRKNIRKLIKKLDVSTKEAAKAEKERKQRIEERQKMYNQMYDEKPEEIKELTSLVLDFDEKTKKPLLQADKTLVKKLKPHQGNGVKFMWDACFESLERCNKETGSGCILAHCMGLGKTLQVITLVHTLLMNSKKTNVFKVLVVCPLSTVLNWVNEFNIWLKDIDRSDEIYVYEISKLKQNVDRANKCMEWHNDGGIMIMGYEMFRNLTSETGGRLRKKIRESLETSLLDPGPDLVVCDEGHLLKNEKTSISKAMNRIQTLRRIVLTGTPLQNNLKEYYCMVQFVKPNLLGKYQEYMNRFVNPITNGQYTDSTQYDIDLMKRRSHVLHNMLNGCVQRRDYGVLTPFLPPKHEYIVSVKLTEMQIKLYKYYMENRSRTQTEDGGQPKRASVLFQDFQNLQRIWTAPRVLRYNSDKYELVQQKKRDMESEDESIGSIKDFLDDESEAETSVASSNSGSDDENSDNSVLSINSDEPLKKSKKKKKEAPVRRTRANAANFEEPEPEPEQQRKENPTEWWMQLCPEEELDNIDHSSKLILLMAILERCEAIGDKLLVFSQSLYSLDVIEHFLNIIDEKTQQQGPVEDENNENLNDSKTKFTGSWSLGLDYFRLDGSTPVEQRNAFCKSFNSPDNLRARLFLISTRAGGLGINLVAANRVIIFDASWNPSHDVQSIFRVYRFGQTKPCYVYRFLALGTMEEKIYERQVTKQAISKRVIDEQQIDRHYNQNDLQELYKYELEPDEERILPILPKDRLFAELLQNYDNIIYKYHEHDTLLENKEEETLNEEERKMAWEEFEQEKNRPQYTNYIPQQTRGIGPVTSNNIFGIRTDVLLKLLSLKARMDNPSINEFQVKQVIPLLMQELYRQMGNGEMTLYSQLIALSSSLETPNKYGGEFSHTNGGGHSGHFAGVSAGSAGVSGINQIYRQQQIQRQIAEQQNRLNKRPPPTINGPVIEIDD